VVHPAALSAIAHYYAAATSPPLRGDELLVAAIRAGDRTAEEQLYRRHAAAILSLATRLLHSRHDAMDVLQDTFVTAFEDLADLREPAAFGAWTRRIAVRLVHRRFRKKKLLTMLGLEGRHTDPEAALEALADSTSSPEARMELRWLDQKLATVSDPDRAAWLLRHIDGLALEEVADACDCSLATAKRRIAAADAVVRQHLGSVAEERGGGAR